MDSPQCSKLKVNEEYLITYTILITYFLVCPLSFVYLLFYDKSYFVTPLFVQTVDLPLLFFLYVFIYKIFFLSLQVGHDWGLYTIISDLPKYTHDVLKFNIAATGILSGLPFLAMTLCATLFGIICDLGIRKKWHSVKTARIIYTCIGEYC